MSFPLHSVRWIRIAITAIAFCAASGTAIALTRFDGGAAFIWVANAVLLASLLTGRRDERMPIIVACWSGGLVASGAWGLGWSASPFIAAANVMEPLIAATFIQRWRVGRAGLDSTRDLTTFVFAAGVIAPGLSGLAGASIIWLSTGTNLAANYTHWWFAHALGAITFTPVLIQLAGGETRDWFSKATLAKVIEAAVLLALVATVTAVAFLTMQSPLLFLPILPLMLVTFRVGQVGSAVAIVITSIIAAVLTLNDPGISAATNDNIGERLQFLQFYLAATVMTILPVTADLSRRATLFDRLRDSEARFRLLTENSTDIILNLSRDGTICYVSPSIQLLGGLDPAALIGTAASDLVDVRDRDRVRATHIRALASPAATFTVEYRVVLGDSDDRWFETNTRAVTDDDGVVQGVVSAIRETSRRRRQESKLSAQANTDPLTGIANRRAFDQVLRERSDKIDRDDVFIALFDLDRFKSINDRFGHAAGDDVLRMFAHRATGQIRADDFLARIGGEEFAIVFRGVTTEIAHAACERVRRAIAAEPVLTATGSIAVTVSVGLAHWQQGQAIASVLASADRALYRSKNDGRNRLSQAA